jgi:hypothetical protein
MKTALESGGMLDTAALIISRKDVIRLIKRITRKARKSLASKGRHTKCGDNRRFAGREIS